jgi:hypothetical protein
MTEKETLIARLKELGVKLDRESTSQAQSRSLRYVFLSSKRNSTKTVKRKRK